VAGTEPISPRQRRAPTAARPVRILLVEDDASEAARFVAELEGTLGAVSAVTVASADAFQEKLASSSWDAIIAEHCLPAFGAAAALEALHAAGRDIPLVIVSGSMRVDEAVAVMRLGARDYVPRTDLSRLGPLVDRELREAAVRQELRESERARAQERAERELVSKQLEFIRSFGNDVLLIVSLDGRIVEANDRAVDAYGYSTDELLRLNLRQLRADDTRDDLAAQLLEAQGPGGTRYTTWHRRRSGERFPVAVSARSIDVAGQVLVQSIVRDLTGEQAARAARTRAEEALRASQERLTRVLETSSEGIWIVDGEGRTEFVNHRAAELFGFVERDAVGRPLVDLVPEPLRARAREDLARMQGGGEARTDLVHTRADGQLAHLVVSRTVLRGAGGEVSGAVAIFMDVTAQRRAWEELVQAQKMEAVGRLASGVAHDFNNLLVAILTNSSFLAEALEEGDPRRQDAVEIHEAGERAARLVRQLLTFARRAPVNPVPTDLNVVIGGFERLLRRTIGEDIRVEVRLGDGLWPTRIDPGNLEQVVMNLAVNARDAMPNGGTLRIETRNEVVGPDGAGPVAPGRHAVLVVEDSGAGIPAELLPRIFEPFFTTKQSGQGTGLGLSTVHGIVTQARGHVGVTSTPGQGTRFTIHLPACDETATRAAAAPSQGARGRGERILVVEDDDTVRATLRRVLERGGYVVVEATNGREALERFGAEPGVALVLSDTVLPEGSGPSLAAAIRTGPRAVPVVLMSGYADRASGPEPVVAKPFTAPALLDTIRRALDAGAAGR
jgi:PAS domain S-box-containing protein